MVQNRPSVLLVNAGLGSSAAAYEQEGFIVSGLIEADKKKRALLGCNFPSRRNQKSIEEWTNFEKQTVDSVDVLDVHIQQKQFDLTKEFNCWKVNIIADIQKLKPKILVMHLAGRKNKGKTLLLWNDLMLLLKIIGYETQVETMNVADYEVPQNKWWTVMTGVRSDIGICPVFPEVSMLTISTRKTINHLMNRESDVQIPSNRKEWLKLYFPPGTSYEQARKKIASHELPAKAIYHRRDLWEMPFQALIPTTTRPLHPEVDRLLRVDEAKLLQTLPDEIQHGDWREICSAPPTKFINKIAGALKQDILAHI